MNIYKLTVLAALFSVLGCAEYPQDADWDTLFAGGSGDGWTAYGGLAWSDRSSMLHFSEATAYCQGLGGRVPSISELRMLIKDCPDSMTGGACAVTADCLGFNACRSTACNGCTYASDGRYSVFGDTNSLWSSSPETDSSLEYWTVNFNSADISQAQTGAGIRVRCVKNP